MTVELRLVQIPVKRENKISLDFGKEKFLWLLDQEPHFMLYNKKFGWKGQAKVQRLYKDFGDLGVSILRPLRTKSHD